MIITGGEPELLCGMAQHAKREGGVYACQYALRVCKSCPKCCVNVLCFMWRSVKKGLCEVTSEKLSYVKAKDGDTDKEVQV